MKRTCEKCKEDFELLPDHPGRSVICRNCIADPERVAKLDREVTIAGKVYEQVGLKMKAEAEPEVVPRRKRK